MPLSVAGIPVPDDLIPVGHISGAYGVVGWVRIHPYSADADALLEGKTWWLDKPQSQDVRVLQVRRQGAELVAQLMGVADRDAAQALKGAVVSMRRSHFPALAPDEVYWCDLIGLEVENLQQEPLGRVVGLMDNGAHPILRVAPAATEGEPEAAELLIPFVAHFIVAVDQPGRKITADWGRDY